MACKINYTTENKIANIEMANGQVSPLFDSIRNHPMIDSAEQALDIYKNLYSYDISKNAENIIDVERGHIFTHRVKGQIVGSYKDALNQTNGEIEAGFLSNSGAFFPVLKLSPTFDTSTEKGFVNSYIKEGIMAEKKITRDGESFYQPSGYSEIAKGVYDSLLGEGFYLHFGSAGYNRTRNGYQIARPQELEPLDEVDSILQNEIKNIFKARVEAKEQNTETAEQKLNEQDLKLRLLDLLNKMGVSVVSIADYVAKYRTKNGVDPSAEALADIANKVVAFKDGEITLDALTEEIAHFIVEGWNQTEIENLLRNVHKTQEWAEFSETYREIYSKDYNGEQLEQAVRREVLGKVLANSLKTGFNTEAKTETQTSIIQRLLDLFNQFVQKVQSLFTQTNQQDLNRFTERVQDLLFENQLSQHLDNTNIEQSPFRLYSVNKAGREVSQAKLQTIQALKVTRNAINVLIKDNVAFNAQKTRLDRNLKQLTQDEQSLVQKQSVQQLIEISDSLLNHIVPKLENAKDDTYPLNFAEENAFHNLRKTIIPLLGQIQDNIERNNKEYGAEWKPVLESLASTIVKSAKLDAQAKNVSNRVIDKLVTNIMMRHNLDEGYRNYVTSWLKNVESDTSHFHKYFGQIVNSKDPILALLGDLGEKTINGANQEYIAVGKNFQEELKRLNVSPSELRQLFDNGHLVDFFNHGKIKDFLEETRAKIRLEVTGQPVTPESIQETIKKAKEQTLEQLDPQQSVEFDRQYNEILNAVQERIFTEDYYKQEQEKYDNNDISQATVNLRRKYSQDRRQLLTEAQRQLPDGEFVTDYSKLSVESEESLRRQQRDRANDKSVYDENGKLKDGISSTNVNDIKLSQQETAEVDLLTQEVSRLREELNNIKDKNLKKQKVAEINKVNRKINNVYTAVVGNQGHIQPVLVKSIVYYIDKTKNQDFSTEAGRVALDLIKLDQIYVAENEGQIQNQEFPQEFIQELQRIEQEQGQEAAKRFLDLNASVFFNEDFWTEFSERGTFLERFKESEIAEDFQQELQDIQELNNQRSELLKKFKTLNKPHEIDANSMHKTTKDRIREIDEQLQSMYKILSTAYKEEDSAVDEVTADPNYNTEVNEAYLNTVEERGFTPQEEIEFIKEHSGSSFNDRIFGFKRSLDRFMAGKEDGIPPSHQQFFDKYEGDLNNRNEVLRDYARTQVASYYKRLVPKEYTEIFEREQSPSKFLQELIDSKYIDVRPHYSWYQAEDSTFKNPKYDNNFNGVLQPKRGDITLPDDSKVNFESEKYKQLFAPDSNGTPTRNKNLYEAREVILNMHRITLENYGIEDSHNLYLVPQVYKKGIDRLKDFLQNVSIKKGVQNLKEIVTYRVDDVEYGEQIAGTKIIPSYYVREVDNKDELTDELFFSYALMAQQSFLHKHRKQNFGDMMALQDAVLSRDTLAGKAKEAKVTIDMFQNYMDYALFGIKESQEFKTTILGQEVDLAKIARGLLNFTKLRNLAFSFIIPATSAFTGEIQYQIEQYVKEITNPSAATLATKEFKKLAYGAMKDMGKFFTTSKLNRLGEFFGIYDMNERFNNSNYNYWMRNINNLAMSTHAMANFPIIPRVMLATLFNFRVVNGSIINFNQYKKTLPEGTTIKQAEKSWKQYESEAIYNYIKVDETGVEFTDGLKDKVKDVAEGWGVTPEAYLAEKMTALTLSIKRNASQIDTQITQSQRVAAQRNFLMNFLMQHRGWLSIAINNRTKGMHRNLSTGQIEEGSYVSLYNFIGDLTRSFLNKKGLKAFAETWNGNNIGKIPQGMTREEVVEVRRRNLRRSAIDLAAVASVAALAVLLLGLADDDKDNLALNAAAYVTLRTVNELVSGGTGVVTQSWDALKSPVVALGTIGEMLKLPGQMFDSEVIQRGYYKGHTGRYRALSKVVPGLRTINEVGNMSDTRENYWYFNNQNIAVNPIGALFVSGMLDD